MPKHRQPTPARRRLRPPVVAASALVLLAVAASTALAATAPDDGETPTPQVSASAPATPTTTEAATGATAAESPEGTESSEPTTDDTVPPSVPAGETSGAGAGGSWLSGASGDGAADGSLGDWRGAPVQIVGTWADQGDNQTELYSIAPGGEVADFDGAIDIAPGGLLDGETWAAAASGAYDDRWRQSLTKMANLRAGKGTTYIRPFHEFNLAGWPWTVSPGDADDFVAAWKRYRAVQQDVFPDAQLVYGVNVTSSGTDLDWRTTWPGAGEADVLGVDTYNGWPTITTTEQFDTQLDATGDDGIPVGLNAYREQAEQWGVPLAVPEWSGRAEMGDEPAFVEGMHDFFAEHAGNGGGQLAYEILFNAPQDDGNFQLFSGSTRMPESSAEYADLFSDAPQAVTPDPTADGATPLPEPASQSSTRTPSTASPTPGAAPTPPATPAPATDPSQVLAEIDEHLRQVDELLSSLRAASSSSEEDNVSPG